MAGEQSTTEKQIGNKETLGFQTEVRQLLDLMIHSLYSNKEIFLRELVSNASDAADKLRFEALGADALYEGDGELRIEVTFDPGARAITVRDNGIGMSRDEVIEHIGTIAKSGTRSFLDSLTGDQAKDAQLIGQFGVGFYSSFIVADRVTLETRRAGAPVEEGVRWESSGGGEYSIQTLPRPERGTAVTLHLREGEDEFLDHYRLRAIINRYSDHIPFPILMAEPAPSDEEGGKESEKKGGPEKAAPEMTTVNRATALWARSRSEIEPEEYEAFYKHVAHDFEAPLETIHSRVEGSQEYISLLFIPKRAPFDLWDRNARHGVKLYVKRVFIMDDAEHLMPPYLRFVRGVIDSADLPLNISREILQSNKLVDAIRAGSVKKVLSALDRMARNEPEKYAEFWSQFGRVLKEGVIEGPANRDDIAKLLRFASTRSGNDSQSVSLEDYLGRMKPGQEAIYYLTGDSYATVLGSPHLEIFKAKGVEVLLLTDPVDEWVVGSLTEFDGKPLHSVSKGDLDLSKIEEGPGADAERKDGEEENAEGASETPAGEMKPLLDAVGKALGERVKEVRVSSRLTTSPACLVAGEHEMGAHLERILKAAGQDVDGGQRILEINPTHPLVKRMQANLEDHRFEDLAHILHDQAVLSEGGQLDDPGAFVRRLNGVLESLAGATG